LKPLAFCLLFLLAFIPLEAFWNPTDSLVLGGEILSYSVDFRDDGSVYLAALVDGGGTESVRFLRSVDHGLSWELIHSHALSVFSQAVKFATGNNYHDFHFLLFSDGGSGLYLLRFPGDFGSPPEEVQIYGGQVLENSIELTRGWGPDFSLGCVWLSGTGQDDTLFFALSEDYGENWELAYWRFGDIPDVIKLVDPRLSLALDGADNFYLAFSGAHFFPVEDSLEIFIRRSEGGIGGSWSTIRVTNNTVPDIYPQIAVGSDTVGSKIWVAFSHFEDGNYDLYTAYSDGGYFEIDLLSASQDMDEYPADMRSVEYVGQSYLNLVTIEEGDGQNRVEWSYCYGDQPTLWASPEYVAEGAISLSAPLWPALSFAPGSPEAGALVFYCDTEGIHVDAPWFPAVHEGGASDVRFPFLIENSEGTFRVTSFQTGYYRLHLYDAAGRAVGRWDFERELKVPFEKSGVFFYRIEGGSGKWTGKVLIVR